MTGKKREENVGARLDRIGRRLVRASAENLKEAESAASSPFLYARLRTRLRDERVRREDRERWRALFGVVWRAVPAMALVTAFALVLFLSISFNLTGAGYSDEALLDKRDAEVERVVFATDRQQLSSDDVLATIWSDDERGASR